MGRIFNHLCVVSSVSSLCAVIVRRKQYGWDEEGLPWWSSGPRRQVALQFLSANNSLCRAWRQHRVFEWGREGEGQAGLIAGVECGAVIEQDFGNLVVWQCNSKMEGAAAVLHVAAVRCRQRAQQETRGRGEKKRKNKMAL